NILDGSGNAWVGFTAGTGLLHQAHEVLSWSVTETSAALPSGSCCLSFNCIQTTPLDCVANQGGVFRQDGGVCNTHTCDGACCTSDSCVITSRDDCTINLSGTFRGSGTICDDFACLGACCDSFGGCFATNQTDCVNNGGTFHGLDSSCDPFPC